MLFVCSIEFLDDLLSQVDRVLVEDHDLHGLFAAFIQHQLVAALVGDRLRRYRDLFHVVIDEFLLLALQFLVKLLGSLLVVLNLAAEGSFLFLFFRSRSI